MTVMTRDGEVALRAAIERDAQAIYALMQEAFGAKYLPFTIYRSQKTIAYLERLIASGNQTYIVAEQHGKLAGYANACYSEDPPILNYIAVTSAARGFGVGNRLLKAVELEVCRQGFRTLSLDVFESNPSVVEWYTKSGYGITSQCFLCRIDLTSTMHIDSPPPSHPSLWQAALAAEEQNGFSMVIANMAEGEITLGFIGGVASKLLGYRGISLDEAIEATIAMLNGTRSELIVVSKQAPKAGHRLLSLEVSLRMVKAL
jgi:ribosomal protein S18 acetylase RimI-like enzyme